MTTSAPAQRLRSRGPKPPLTREAVVAAARDCLRDGGPGGLTMRKLAARLETGPASLYAHVADQDELHVLVLDSIAAEVHVPERQRDGGDGDDAADADHADHADEAVVGLLLTYARRLFDHPGAARLALLTPPTGPAFLDLLETVMGLLVDAGLPVARAAWAVDPLVLLVTAAMAEQDAWHARDSSGTLAEVYGAALDVSAARPHLAAGRSALVSGDGEQRLAWALRTFLAGLTGAPVPAGPPLAPDPRTTG
ncbi:TetR/AcrR family transcriptional regulator [Cellulomonas hominis]